MFSLFLCPPQAAPPFVLVFPLNPKVNVSEQEGEFYAHSATFGFTSLIPKAFLNTSFEAEEAAKELTIQAEKKITAEQKSEEVAKKSVKASNAKGLTKQESPQKPVRGNKKTEQKTAPAPAKEDVPVICQRLLSARGPPPPEAVTAFSLELPFLPRRCTAL